MASSVSLNFFAAESDLRAILDFLFSQTDARVFESYSDYDAELREFRSISDLATAFPIGIDEHGNGHAVLLQLWSPSVMERLTITRFALNPRACEGHTFRHRIDGGALMQLYCGGVHKRVVTQSHFGRQSQSRAVAWGVADGIDWEAAKKLANRILYHIRSRLAAAKVRSCPVLPEALTLARSGYELKVAAQSPWAYELPRPDG
jgi:hypothetical protein